MGAESKIGHVVDIRVILTKNSDFDADLFNTDMMGSKKCFRWGKKCQNK